MVVGALAIGAAVAVAVFAAAPEPAKDAKACAALAKSVVTKVEGLPMMRRARAIELAIRRDPQIFCGVIDQAFFGKSPDAPPGCERSKPHTCAFPKGLEVAKRLAEDSDPVVYLRVQTIATRLRERGLFTEPHERLLATLLLSSQIAREEERHHQGGDD